MPVNRMEPGGGALNGAVQQAGFEPATSHLLSERSASELLPLGRPAPLLREKERAARSTLSCHTMTRKHERVAGEGLFAPSLALEGITGAIAARSHLLGGATSNFLLLARRLTHPDGRDGGIRLLVGRHDISFDAGG